MPTTSILFVAADPGGANAILPVIPAALERGAACHVVEHGLLGEQAHPAAHRHSRPPGQEAVDRLLDELSPAVLVFGTAVADTLPLAMARSARTRGIKVVCVLDNWGNYRYRMGMDGLPLFLPDIYVMMDEKARQEALAEGLPDRILKVTGHPGLALLADQWRACDAERRAALRHEAGFGRTDRQLVVFISEPVAKDQGGPGSPNFRGYTERSVLTRLTGSLKPLASEIELAILPHPRDDLAALEALWQDCRGPLEGHLVRGLKGRDMVLAADRVAGMASILLYESWLIGRPTMSFQPGLCRDGLLSIASRDGIVLVKSEDQVEGAIDRWWRDRSGSPKPDLALHQDAAANVTELLLN